MKSTPRNNPCKTRVLLGMSGGVDSSVALFLLKEQGFEVIGLTLLTSDRSLLSIPDVEAVCARAGIKLIIADVREHFRQVIIKDFVSGYLQGRTPNPCVLCNPLLKFAVLLAEADKNDCAFIATGHYAAIEPYRPTGRLALTGSAAGIKDQTYFLYRLTQEQLGRIIFPLSGMNKAKTRETAAALDLTGTAGKLLAGKKDSQDNCFIGEEGYAEFIRNHLMEHNEDKALSLLEPGPVLDISGKEIGSHRGLVHYTIGQRRGFQVQSSERLFVIGKSAADNALVVGSFEHILRKAIRVADPVYSGLAGIEEATELEARIRYSARPVPCTVTKREDGSLQVVFAEPAAAPAPGQSCVFYRGNQVMAGGFINMAETGFRSI